MGTIFQNLIDLTVKVASKSARVYHSLFLFPLQLVVTVHILHFDLLAICLCKQN